MQIEISDPAYMESLRAHLQREGCPSEPRTDEVVEVRVLWSPERPLTDGEQRAKVFGLLREWCADNPGVKANLLS
jgi:hypothetical protein